MFNGKYRAYIDFYIEYANENKFSSNYKSKNGSNKHNMTLMLNKLLVNYQIIILDVNKRQRKPNVQSRMDNLETRATLGTRHRTKRNKTRTPPKTWGLVHVFANGKQFLFVIAYVVYINFRACCVRDHMVVGFTSICAINAYHH